MIDTDTPLTFTANFTADVLAKANRFRQQQRSPQKAEQVYLNTLAVYAVEFYCLCMGVEVRTAESDSETPALQTLLDVADLAIDKGHIECRPVLPQQDTCPVPPEAMDERLGYVMVEIDLENRAAKLLGFSKTTPAGVLSREMLQPLDDLIDVLVPPEPLVDTVISAVQTLGRVPTKLGNWLNEIFEAPWQPPELALAASYRGVTEPASGKTAAQKERAKVIVVGEYQFVLVVKITPMADAELDILIKLHPGGDQVLPQGLLLELLDNEANVAMTATAKAADNFIAINFQIETQEAFNLRITAGSSTITEAFMS